MSDIFISYRREDSAGHAGRLYDGLVSRFRGANVFIDVDSIQPGVDFVKHMQDAVAKCDVLLVIIGDEWANVTDHAGRRRLDDPQDFVRVEVAAALERDVPVLPVLIEGATMPASHELPEDIQDLARHNAIELSDARWRYDVTRLEEAIKRLAPATGEMPAVQRVKEHRPRGKRLAAVAAGVVALVVVAVVVLAGGGDSAEDEPVAASSASLSLSECGAVETPARASVFVNPVTTTCPFARNVAKAALAESTGGATSFDISAFSPKTAANVDMRCTVEEAQTECRGGRAAFVRVVREN